MNMDQFEMKEAVYRSRLKNRALQVLLYLIDRANREQTCFPAVPTISRELHISISTVKRAMRELVEAGYVEKESRFREGNRGQTSNLYTLHFPEQRKDEEGAGQGIQQESVEGQGAEGENVLALEQGKPAGDSFTHVDGGGGHSATPLNCSLNRKQKVEKKYYREFFRFGTAGIREPAQGRYGIP